MKYQLRHDQEHLRQRAVELNQQLSTFDSDKRLAPEAAKEATEELESVMERLQMVQGHLDELAVLQGPEVDGTYEFVPSPRPKAAPMPQRPAKEGSSHANGPAKASPSSQGAATTVTARRSAPMSLGDRLLEELREDLRPTLLEQLGGLDSPLQPPQVISTYVEATLRRHLTRRRKQIEAEMEEAGESVGHSSAELHVELADALLALLRAIARDHKARLASKGGADARLQRQYIDRALASGEGFEGQVMRAKASAGQTVSLAFNDESLEVRDGAAAAAACARRARAPCSLPPCSLRSRRRHPAPAHCSPRARPAVTLCSACAGAHQLFRHLRPARSDRRALLEDRSESVRGRGPVGHSLHPRYGPQTAAPRRARSPTAASAAVGATRGAVRTRR